MRNICVHCDALENSYINDIHIQYNVMYRKRNMARTLRYILAFMTELHSCNRVVQNKYIIIHSISTNFKIYIFSSKSLLIIFSEYHSPCLLIAVDEDNR